MFFCKILDNFSTSFFLSSYVNPLILLYWQGSPHFRTKYLISKYLSYSPSISPSVNPIVSPSVRQLLSLYVSQSVLQYIIQSVNLYVSQSKASAIIKDKQYIRSIVVNLSVSLTVCVFVCLSFSQSSVNLPGNLIVHLCLLLSPYFSVSFLQSVFSLS